MMVFIGFILVIIGLLGLFYCLISDYYNRLLCKLFNFFSFIGVVLLLIGITAHIATKDKRPAETPKAIDVYQGKTTLQITYEDSIPVDSVVVYKPEFRK